MSEDHSISRPKPLYQTKEYATWSRMKARCYNPNRKAYRSYGARGIHVCARWRDSFMDFLKDMGFAPSADHSIDRINNEGGYTCGGCGECRMRGDPANCRWATLDVQLSNKGTRESPCFGGRVSVFADPRLKPGLRRARVMPSRKLHRPSGRDYVSIPLGGRKYWHIYLGSHGSDGSINFYQALTALWGQLHAKPTPRERPPEASAEAANPEPTKPQPASPIPQRRRLPALIGIYRIPEHAEEPAKFPDVPAVPS